MSQTKSLPSSTSSSLVDSARSALNSGSNSSSKSASQSGSRRSPDAQLPSPIEFYDLQSFFAIPSTSPTTSTFIFPPPAYLGSERNGTRTAEAKAYLTSPRKTAAIISRQARNADFKKVQEKFARLMDDASDAAMAKVNHAFEGKDVGEMMDTMQSKIPTIPLPTARQLGNVADKLTDAIKFLLEKFPAKSKLEEPSLEIRQWQFTLGVGKKAREALVRQGICQAWQIMPSRQNIMWQTELNQCLMDMFAQYHGEYKYTRLIDMKPVWIGDRRRNVWHLVLETGITEIVERNGGFEETAEYIVTGFELTEQAGWSSIYTCTLSSSPVEGGDWEMVH